MKYKIAMSLKISIILYFTLYLALPAMASSECTAVYYRDNREEWREAIRTQLSNLINGNGLEKPLYFYWHQNYPSLVKFENNQFVLHPSTKRARIYRTHSDPNASNPIEVVNTLFAAKSVQNWQLIDAFLTHFEPRASHSIVQNVREVEAEIAEHSEIRQGYGYVGFMPYHIDTKVIGSWRLYNGTASHSDTPAELPFEIGYKKMGIKSKTAARLDEIRRRDPNRRIFEIGKRFFDREAPGLKNSETASVIKRVRSILDIFLLQTYIDMTPPNTLFEVQVSDPDLVVSLNSRYGFRVVEIIRPEGQKEADYILEVEGHEISTHLRKIFHIPRLQFPVKIAL